MKRLKTEITSLAKAKKLTLEVWEEALRQIDNGEHEPDMDTEYYIVDIKGRVLEGMGYNLKKNCPMCHWFWQLKENDDYGFHCTEHECQRCPLFHCLDEGYDDFMPRDDIETFIEFLRERLKVKKKE